MKAWSKYWISSKQVRKQRKYRLNAPLHIRRKFLAVALSKDLKKKYNRNAIPVRKGDKVKIMRGQFKKQSGKIDKVLLKDIKVYVEGIEQVRRDGTKSFYPIHPSNLQITELILEDKRRKRMLEKKMEIKGEKKHGQKTSA